MIRSMTGFARREHVAGFGTLIWEVRTVNHRYLETSLRLPEEFRALEGEFRRLIGSHVRRGKLDATLQYRPAAGSAVALELDGEVLDQLVMRVQEVTARSRSKVGELARVTPVELLRWPGVLREPQRENAPLHETAQKLLEDALAALAETRASEGGRISAMLRSRCQQIGELADAVAARLPEVRTRAETRLRERVTALAAELSRERLEQEVALLVARLDVDEELDRLRSHIVEVAKALAGDEPSGRRLDFLMQEFNREANTLSSKSQDVETTRAALDMKVLIEQMREQVQNVE
jgi:uncharacterized protein (TIGR00255 family)